MRILVVQETDWEKRGPHQQHHLFERLAARGHEVTVVDFEFLWRDESNPKRFRGREVRQPTGQVVDDAPISLVRPSMVKLPLLDMGTIPFIHGAELRRQFEEFEPDVVIAFGILNAAVGSWLSNRYNVPFVYYLIDHLHTLVPSERLQPVAKAVEAYTARSADYVYAINDGLAEYAVSLGADEAHVHVLPGGVDLHRYRAGTRDAVELPTELPPDREVLFFMGWLYDFSGLDEITSVLADDAYEGYTLLVVGEGDLYEELQERNSELGDRLVLTGQVPFEDIPHYLDYADVCLLPARHNDVMDDIVPIKMYEYLAADCPVVATELPGIRKEFGDGNGIVYADGPEDALRTAVELLEGDEYSTHRESARAFVEDYDWPTLAEQFEAQVERIASSEWSREQVEKES